MLVVMRSCKEKKKTPDKCKILAPYRIVISCLLVSTRQVMTKPSVKCQQHRPGLFLLTPAIIWLKNLQRSHYCIILWALTARRLFGRKTAQREHKPTVKHDFIYSTHTLLSERVSEYLRHGWPQKTAKIVQIGIVWEEELYREARKVKLSIP